MATGTIDAQEIGNGSGPVTLTKQSAAKAWANLNGQGTIALRDSQNISGVVDIATGQYEFSFSASMSNLNYSVTTGCSPNTSGSSNRTVNAPAGTAPTVSAIRALTNKGSNDTIEDMLYVNISIHGDLAT